MLVTGKPLYVLGITSSPLAYSLQSVTEYETPSSLSSNVKSLSLAALAFIANTEPKSISPSPTKAELKTIVKARINDKLLFKNFFIPKTS